MANNDNEFGAFLSGLVLGGLVGAAAALLLAPQSGEETRAYIRDKGIELKDLTEEKAVEARRQAEAKMAEARAQAEAKVAEARQQADQIIKQAQTKADELRQQGQVVLDEQKSKLGEAIEAGKKAISGKGSKSTSAPAEEAPGEA
jgi:gas vesicle protein